jgi:hypothetical protein
MSMAVPVVSSIEGVTPEWLTGALRDGGVSGDATVVAIDVAAVGTGQLGDCYRLVPTYDRDAADAPVSVVAKLPSTNPVSRQFAGSQGLYANEVLFYRSIASRLEVRAPHPFHAAIAADGFDFDLILEDMAPAHACDQISGCSLDQAGLAMEQAAAIHGPSWAQPDLVGHPGVMNLADAYRSMLDGWNDLQATFRERYADVLEPEYLDLGDRLAERMPNWVTYLDDAPCLVHVDFRLDNMLFDAQDGAVPLAVVDWQSLSTGPGIADVAYFIGAGLLPNERAEHEEELVRHYYSELRVRGVDGYSWDDCWTGYQVHAVMGFVTAVNASVNVKRTPRGDDMFMTMARRHGTQMVANESLHHLDRPRT